MNFVVMLPGFAALATRICNLRMVEMNSPSKVIDPKKKGELEFKVISCRRIGRDEQRYTYDVGTDQNLVTYVGVRRLGIQVRFKGFDHSPGQDAAHYLERLGDRITWDANTQALNDLGLSIIEVLSFVNLSRVLDASDRQWSMGAKDFIFNALYTETPDHPGDDNTGDWIKTVTWVSDTLDGEDGNPLPHQISGTVTRP